jgi:hypothetical protein
MPQTAFGPLIEPVHPPPAPDLGQTFLNAFYIGSQINAKKQALENQLALQSLKIQQQEGDAALREKKFEQSQQFGEWKHQTDRPHAGSVGRRRIDKKRYQLQFDKFDDGITIN